MVNDVPDARIKQIDRLSDHIGHGRQRVRGKKRDQKDDKHVLTDEAIDLLRDVIVHLREAFSDQLRLRDRQHDERLLDVAVVSIDRL